MIIVNVNIERLTAYPRIVDRERIIGWGVEVTYGKGHKTSFEEHPLTINGLLHAVTWLADYYKLHTVRMEKEYDLPSAPS